MSSIIPICENQPVVYHNLKAAPSDSKKSSRKPSLAAASKVAQSTKPVAPSKKPNSSYSGNAASLLFPSPPSFLLGKRKASEYDSSHACRSDKFTTEDAVKAVGNVEVIKDEHSTADKGKEYARCGHRYQSCGYAALGKDVACQVHLLFFLNSCHQTF